MLRARAQFRLDALPLGEFSLRCGIQLRIINRNRREIGEAGEECCDGAKIEGVRASYATPNTPITSPRDFSGAAITAPKSIISNRSMRPSHDR